MNARFGRKLWLGTAAAGLTTLLALGLAGCNGCSSSTAPAPIITNANNANGPDPADANLAFVGSTTNGQPTKVLSSSQSYTPQQSGEAYPQGGQAAPIVRGPGSSYNESQNYNTAPQGAYDNQQGYDQGYDQGYAVAEADQPPPPLPEYDQPPAPDDNDIWTPGYWSYANTGYYWVPGAWVTAPYVGALWTPGYWGWYGHRYRFHHGYWGRHIGFYGGINYGWGYVGTGYYGGYWNGPHFYYNRSITHVSPRVRTVYERPVVINNVRYAGPPPRAASYNGGRGGLTFQPRPYEVAAMHENHIGPLPAQMQFHQQAALNRANFYNENHGRPAQAAWTQPIVTHGFGGNPNGPAAVGAQGFNRPGQPGFATNGAVQQHNVEQAQRLQMEQQRNLQLQQHNVQQQQRVQMEQGRNLQLQQHNNMQMQQGQNLQLQRNAQMEQQRNQLQQHNVQMEQQRNLQLQQHNIQAEQGRNLQLQQGRNGELQQRNLQMEQQRNAQVQQQHSAELQQRNQLEQQRGLQMQGQREAMMQQRNAQAEQQRGLLAQPHTVQAQPQPRVEQPRFQPQSQPRMEQPRIQAQPQPPPQAQPRVEQPRFQPQPQAQPRVEQPRFQPQSQPQAQPHPEAPHAQGPPS